jgi:nicotinamidase-related amidase
MQGDRTFTPTFPDASEFPTPAPVELSSQDTVFVVVDMQNDFVRENGKIYTGPMVLGAKEKIRQLLSQARTQGMKVLYTQSWYERDDPGFSDHPKAKQKRGG